MDNMESRAFVIKSESNPRIRIEAVPGHFVTSHSHINYCLNITQVKHVTLRPSLPRPTSSLKSLTRSSAWRAAKSSAHF